MSGATMNASQKLPVDCSVAHASTVPTMEEVAVRQVDDVEQAEDDVARLHDEGDDQPQIRPFIASSSSLSIVRAVIRR